MGRVTWSRLALTPIQLRVMDTITQRIRILSNCQTPGMLGADCRWARQRALVSSGELASGAPAGLAGSRGGCGGVFVRASMRVMKAGCAVLCLAVAAAGARAEDVERQVGDLLGRMTLEEKVGQL